jgi:uncharacterized protein YkwD
MINLHNPRRTVRGAVQRRPKRRVVVTATLLLLGAVGVAAPALLPEAEASPTAYTQSKAPSLGSADDSAMVSTENGSVSSTAEPVSRTPAAPPRTRPPVPSPSPDTGVSLPLPRHEPWPREPRPRHTEYPSPGARAKADIAMERQVITLVNQRRADAGCGPVAYRDRLASAAFHHSKDMAVNDFFSHTGSDGSTPWDRAKRAGYKSAHSENLAAGHKTAEAVVQGWMDSPKHRTNLLNCRSKGIGVGMRRGGSHGIYWTQMFGTT